MIGRTLAHYRITAALGAGGMGEVWRATDTKLGREVALKVLPEEFVDDPQRLDRFEREARAVAALNHPHIVTIHSVEEEDGVRFLTMELVEGQTLDALIPEGGFEIERFFELATPLAEAVSAAHDRSVIHRDLKPTNVMVDRNGRVKVMDFGLAKVASTEDPSDSSELPTEALTGIGTIVGTVPYMSPEQIEGETVDHRTDIFSLGVLLYEMAVGERPFQGKSSPSLMSSILKDAPTPVVELRADLPRHLGRIIGRCLEKDRRDRYQTARDVFNELKALQREASSMATPGPRPAVEPSREVTRPPSHPSDTSSAVSAGEGFWVAVMPFKYSGGEAEIVALAEGLSEDIVTGLSRFSYLRVVASGSAARDPRYLIEGSFRKAGTQLRLSVHLVDVTTGTHLWAETYERAFNCEAVFELQDELVPRIVSTVADMHGVLPRSMGEALRSYAPDQLSPYQAVLRSFVYFSRLTADELAAARSALELAVQKAPAYTDAWALLALLCAQEYGQDFNLLPDALAVGADAARRAVETGPSNHLAYFSLAQVLFFKKEFEAFRNAAERAVALNPMDGNSIAFLGELLVNAGDVERGLELAERAKQLNPHHPGWYWMPDFYHAYSRGDYSAALAIALKMNLPGHIGMHFFTAAASGQLGKQETATAALRSVLELRPDIAESARSILLKWWNPEHVEHLIDGIRKAGFDIPAAQGSDLSSNKTDESPVSGATRADEGFWVAVLPFKVAGDKHDLVALANGLFEEVVTGLSRFSYLRVIASSSTTRYANEAYDIRTVGRELGARYVMEGSLRQAGTKIRVAVQLVDTESCANLWAESYDRDFDLEEIFTLQDDLVPRIVSTCGDHFGVLARAISEAVRDKPLTEITPYQALMRGFGYHFRLSPDEHAKARDALERAVEQAPANADCWAMLSWVYSHEFAHDFNPRSGSLDRGLEAARKAVDLAPSNPLAQQVLAVALFFRKELAACLSACERALVLNPFDGSNEAIFITCFAGDWDRGCGLIRRAMELNPHHPRWYGLVLAIDEYRRENYRAAVDEAVRANAFEIFWTNWLLAAAYGQLGEMDPARTALDDLLIQKPDFAQSGRDLMEKWYQPELVEHFEDGLRKAGLEERSSVSSTAPAKIDSGGHRHTVGRQSEFDVLRTALEAARGGRGSLVCVAGEPGIGKTTLVEGFLAEAVADDRCIVARGRSSERIGGSDAYLPVLEALTSLLQSSKGEDVASVIKQTAPAWYAQIAPLSGESDESIRLLEQVKETTQERLKLNFVACVQELSQSRPLVLFFDDLHWADESTVDLLSFLAGKFDGLNVLVVATYRPSDMQLSKHAFLQIKPDLQTRGVCRELLLGFLGESEISEYLDLEFPDHHLPPEFPALIHEKTEGSPLFMADLVRYLRDDGAIDEVDGEWRLTHGLPEIERELPESVRGMIERKIGQLGEDDLALLTAASVQGYAFDSAIAAQVLGLPPEEIEERLETLERVHAFVKFTGETELPDRTMTLRYRFVHVLYQDALYAGLKPTGKARLSQDVGQALETAHAKNTRKVAHELAALFETGRDSGRAAEYYLMAAGQANAVFAHREAATLATDGLRMVEKLDPSPERSRTELELQLALGLALRSVEGFGHFETGNAYTRARELCHEIGDAPQLFPVLFGLWEFFQNQGDLEAAVDVGEQMLALAERGDDVGQMVAAHAVMADNLVCVGNPVSAIQHAARAVELYVPDEHRPLGSLFGYDPAVSAHSMGALALWLAGYPDRAIREATAGADLSGTFTDPASMTFGPIFASWIRQLTGSLEEAREVAERNVTVCTELDFPMFGDFARVCLGETLISQGEVEKGTKLARTGVDRLAAVEFGWARSFTLGVVARGCAGAGRYEEALTLIEKAFDHARGTGEHFNEPELHRLKGEFLLSSDPLESEGCFMSAIELAQHQGAKSWELRATLNLARLWQEQGRIAEARKKLEQVYSWFTEGFDTADLRAAKALLEELSAAKGELGQNADTQPAEGETKSIVVLPFANLSPDPDTEYFSDGLTDEIITDLSRVRALRVISRSSAMRLKGDERGLGEIGLDLDCRYVLEGSVRRAANNLRITTRLVDAPNDVQIWSDKFKGTLDDVFDIQERVSRSIVDALEIRLTPHEDAQLAERPIDDVRAQESYLRARNEIWSFMPGGLDLAISHLEAALELIGDNALIYQGLGEAYFQYVNIGAAVGREEELVRKAEACVDKIFSLEPDSPRGHLVRGQTRMARGDIHGCGRSFRRVLQAFPNEIVALQLYSHTLGWLGGKPEAAALVATRLVDLDPLNPMSLLMQAMVPLFAGRFEEAIEPARRMFDLDPVTPVWRANYAMALGYAGQLDEAEALTGAVDAQPDSDVGTWWMGLCRATWREDRAEVLRLSDGPYQKVAEWDAEIPWALATAHASVGATDEALLWLERAIDQGMINYPFLSDHDRYLDNIRGDRRFDRAMDRAKREWERLDEVLP